MNIFEAVILGIVEGVTEFLPVSSTGHLILTSYLFKLDQTDFLKTFEITIQLGAILAVVVLYWRWLFLNKKIIKRLAAAFLPTAVIGLLFYKSVKHWLGLNEITLWALFLGGILLVFFELVHKEKPEATDNVENLSYTKSLAVGLFQSIAIIPGISRSAATILGGLLLGVKRQTIVEFSFLLAVPTILAATVLDVGLNFQNIEGGQWFVLGAGFVTSFFIAMVSIKFLLRYIKNHTFIPFGVYRIALSVIYWLFIL